MRTLFLFGLPFAVLCCTPAVTPDAGPDVDAGLDAGPELDARDTAAFEKLAVLMADGLIRGADVNALFAPSFLEQVPVAQLAASMNNLFAETDAWTFREAEGAFDDLNLVAVLDTERAGPWRAQISVELEPPHLINGLLLSPAFDLDDTLPSDFESIANELSTVAEKSALFVAELDDCTPLFSREGERSVPLGSVFKLYVLSALADEVAQGNLAWTDELAIDDELKSLPSGVMQDEPAGARFDLETYAAQMISISDNTATDHLIAHLGRARVEAELSAAGHSAPTDNVPFLMTRELFLLKGALNGNEVANYLALDDEARRVFLDDELSGRSMSEVSLWSGPRLVEELEWFASGEDLCRLLRRLDDQRAFDSAVGDVLSINGGLPFDDERFPFIGFKGGSEPGVLIFAWLLERDDGRTFALVVSTSDTTVDISSNAVARLALAASFVLEDTP